MEVAIHGVFMSQMKNTTGSELWGLSFLLGGNLPDQPVFFHVSKSAKLTVVHNALVVIIEASSEVIFPRRELLLLQPSWGLSTNNGKLSDKCWDSANLGGDGFDS